MSDRRQLTDQQSKVIQALIKKTAQLHASGRPISCWKASGISYAVDAILRAYEPDALPLPKVDDE